MGKLVYMLAAVKAVGSIKSLSIFNKSLADASITKYQERNKRKKINIQVNVD